jgi:Flp pilus assembly protein TadD
VALARTAARIALACAAIVLVVVLAGWRQSDSRCDRAGSEMAAAQKAQADPAPPEPALRTLGDSCHDTTQLLAAARLLLVHGRSRQAEPLARTVLRREPDNPGAWAALAAALGDREPAAADRAQRRAHELNPAAIPTRRG